MGSKTGGAKRILTISRHLLRMQFLALFVFVFWSANCAHFQSGKTVADPCNSRKLLQEIRFKPASELLTLKIKLLNKTYKSVKARGCRDVLVANISKAMGDVDGAMHYFAKGEAELTYLAPYFQAARAQIAFENRRYKMAKQIAESMLAESASLYSAQVFHRIQLLLANVDVAEQNHHQVIQSHKALLAKGIGEKAILLYHLAEALVALGMIEDANQVYQELLSKYPEHTLAKTVEQSVLQNQTFRFPQRTYIDRFKSLMSSFEPEQITREAKQIRLRVSNSPSKEEIALHKIKVEAFIRSGKKEEGVKYAFRLASLSRPPDEWLEVNAWALSKSEKHQNAAKAWARLKSATKNNATMAKACFFEGFSQYEASLYAITEVTWQRCLPAISKTEWYEKTLWYLAFVKILQDRHQDAQSALSKLIQHFPQSKSHAKYLYWLAESMRHANKNKAALKLFRLVSKKFPLDYYGFLARKSSSDVRIKGRFVAADSFMKKGDKLRAKWALDAKLLYQLNFEEDARRLVQKKAKRGASGLGLLQSVGGFHNVYQLGYYLLPSRPIVKHRLVKSANWRSHYPKPWPMQVEKQSKKNGVDPSLAYAIMHSESGFSTQAKSRRGALGLMQLIPKIAKNIAKRHNLRTPSRRDLHQPHTSIQIGTCLLGEHIKTFGKVYLAAAAYNGSKKQVVKWLKEFGNLKPELFIERIPFWETRAYVKKVLVKKAIYEGLEGKNLALHLS